MPHQAGSGRELIWAQEAAGSNPTIPTGNNYFPNLSHRGSHGAWLGTA